MKQQSSKWKWVGALIVGVLIVLAWSFGFLPIIFYILGFYAAIYFVSIIFRTTVIINTILGILGFTVWAGVSIFSLYALYQVLQYMFEGNFVLGLLILVFGAPLFQTVVYGLIAALGAPLIWFSSDLEERFGSKNNDIYTIPQKEVQAIEERELSETSGKMFCKECGQENKTISNYCVKCGTPQKKLINKS